MMEPSHQARSQKSPANYANDCPYYAWERLSPPSAHRVDGANELMCARADVDACLYTCDSIARAISEHINACAHIYVSHAQTHANNICTCCSILHIRANQVTHVHCSQVASTRYLNTQRFSGRDPKNLSKLHLQWFSL